MKIVIVGCERLGAELAERCFLRGHEVIVVDEDTAAFDMLPTDFVGRRVEGNILNQDIVQRAEIASADTVAVVTNSDMTNLAAGHMIRSICKVPNVVVRNFDSICRPLFESFGLQVISTSSWGAQRIEEMLYHSDVHTVYSTGNGEVEIYEFLIPEALNGKRAADVFAEKDGAILVSLTRAGKASLPTSDSVLETGDVVHISATFEGVRTVRERINAEQEVK